MWSDPIPIPITELLIRDLFHNKLLFSLISPRIRFQPVRECRGVYADIRLSRGGYDWRKAPLRVKNHIFANSFSLGGTKITGTGDPATREAA